MRAPESFRSGTPIATKGSMPVLLGDSHCKRRVYSCSAQTDPMCAPLSCHFALFSGSGAECADAFSRTIRAGVAASVPVWLDDLDFEDVGPPRTDPQPHVQNVSLKLPYPFAAFAILVIKQDRLVPGECTDGHRAFPHLSQAST
jgi:hypothetical protein